MKIHIPVWTALWLLSHPALLLGQGTTFSYQGFLTDNGAPANGVYDLEFRVFSAVVGGTQQGNATTNNDIAITNGLFTVAVNPGAGVFNGFPRWLNVAVRPGASPAAFTNLNPRQPVLATAYALYAGRAAAFDGTVPNNQLAGNYSNALNFSSTANVFTGSGGGLSNVNATFFNGMTSDNFWKLGGNTGVGSFQYLGTSDTQPLQLAVNGNVVFRLEWNTNSIPNLMGGLYSQIAPESYASTIGGGFGNLIEAGASGSVIAGGMGHNINSNAYNASMLGGNYNRIATNSGVSTLVGGESQLIDQNCSHAFIGGGLQNIINRFSSFSTIGGGNLNVIMTNTAYATIGGGKTNRAGGYASTLGGGELNIIQAGADRATIGGGLQNTVTGSMGTVPGGFGNSATNFSMAMGRRAKANHRGCLVWADTIDADFNSSATNQVSMRASGGYSLYSNGSATSGVFINPGGTSWGAISDQNAKKNFTAVDTAQILERLARLPLHHWNYLWESDDSVPHVGPVAQDFKAAFYPGRDDKTITTLEFDGVALAALQGLNQKVENTQRHALGRLETLEQQNAQLQETVQELRQLVEQLMAQTQRPQPQAQQNTRRR